MDVEESLGPRILLVEDDAPVARALSRGLKRDGYAVEVAATGNEAREKLDGTSFDIMCLDLILPDAHGFEVLQHAQALTPRPVTIILSASADAPAVVRALRLGAVDFVEKGSGMQSILQALSRALGTTATLKALEQRSMLKELAPAQHVRSRGTKVAYKMAERVARTPNSSVLILGETGVGKGVLARYIHDQSKRAAQPFVAVNVAALPDSMVEAELFGATKGSFTGSERKREGLIASADGGTLLLDEVFEFKPELQAKLLQVLEERKFFPIGSDEPRTVDMRVVAATNQNPDKAVQEGTLRSDLYFRLSTVVIYLPPLRERREEILPLADSFVRHFASEFELDSVPRLSPDATEALGDHPWPGNVRQLRNSIERAMMMCDDGVLTAEHLNLAAAPTPTSTPASVSGVYARDLTEPNADSDLSLEEAKQHAVEFVERRHIERALKLVDQSPSEAAKLLGISRSTLWGKMKRYKLR
ncbi:MAG: sigma-54 dependent transcriptional regulator [Myxococcota bacterium]